MRNKSSAPIPTAALHSRKCFGRGEELNHTQTSSEAVLKKKTRRIWRAENTLKQQKTESWEEERRSEPANTIQASHPGGYSTREVIHSPHANVVFQTLICHHYTPTQQRRDKYYKC